MGIVLIQMNRLRKLLVILGLHIILVSFVGLMLHSKSAESELKVQNINPIRLYVNEFYTMCEQGISPDRLVQEAENLKIQFSLVSVEGEVVLSNTPQVIKGQLVDLKEFLFFDAYYEKENGAYRVAFPIQSTKPWNGYLVMSFSKDLLEQIYPHEKSENNWLIIYITLILLFIPEGYWWYRSVKTRLLRPSIDLENALIEATKGQLKVLKIMPNNDLRAHFIAFNRMVEELKYRIKQQQELEIQSKKFVATVSHELKTPLTSIMAYIEGLKSHIAKDSATQERYIHIIDDKAKKLALQIEELFKLSQLNMDKLKVNLEEQYVKEAFDQILEPIGKQLESEGIQFSLLNLAPKSLVKMDLIRIEQVLLNLVNNSKKHLKEDGQIRIRVSKESNQIVTEVSDNGCGILPKDLPYIFDYFYQGEISRKSDYEGAGLGLAICKHIIEAHGGCIYVKSSIDTGSTFYFDLPLL